MNQISLIHKKIVHLEETLKLEEEEDRLNQKLDFHHSNSSKEADLLARKEDENTAEQQELLLEEGARRVIVSKMIKEGDGSLSQIKEVLVHFEGTPLLNFFFNIIAVCFFNNTGSFNKLNRQFKYSNECQRLQTEKNTKIETGVLEVLKEVKEIKQHLIQYNYIMRMESVDISHLFPFKSNDDVNTFMNRDQGWNERRKESFFYT